MARRGEARRGEKGSRGHADSGEIDEEFVKKVYMSELEDANRRGRPLGRWVSVRKRR